MQDQIFSFFGTMASYGPGSSVNDNVHGLMAFGLLIVVVLALVKIVLNSQNSNQETAIAPCLAGSPNSQRVAVDLQQMVPRPFRSISLDGRTS